nr:hypothetical protein CFP56_65305 [Quercus suber]
MRRDAEAEASLPMRKPKRRRRCGSRSVAADAEAEASPPMRKPKRRRRCEIRSVADAEAKASPMQKPKRRRRCRSRSVAADAEAEASLPMRKPKRRRRRQHLSATVHRCIGLGFSFFDRKLQWVLFFVLLSG